MRKQPAITVSKLACALAPVAVLAMLSLSTARANLYWDTNGPNPGATDGTAADGTWGSDNFWSSDPTGGSATGAWNPFDTAIFSAGNNAVTANIAVTGTQNFSGLQFLTGTTTLGGSGTLDYNEDGTVNPSIVVPSGQTATINTVINGDGLITLSGGGTVNFGTTQTQANTFGSFSGVVGDNFVSTGALDITGGSKLVFAGENNATAGAANALGAAPASAISNYITLDNGILSNTKSDTSGTSSFVLPDRGIIVTANGGTFDLPAAGTKLLLPAGGSTAIGGIVNKTGPGMLMIRNNWVITGTTGLNILGGTVEFDSVLRFGPTAGPDLGFITLNGSTLWFSGTGNGSSILTTNTQLNLGANGGTIQSSDNPNHTTAQSCIYSGVLKLLPGVTSATLYKTGDGEFRASNIGWQNTKLEVDGGTYRLSTSNASFVDTAFGAVPATYDPSAIYANGVGTNRATDGAAIALSASATTPATRGITISANGLTVVSNATWTVNSIITGPGGLTLNENGWNPTSATSGFGLILTGANTFQGPVQINDGTLELRGGAAIPDNTAITIASASANTTPAETKAVLLVTNAETIGSLAGGGGSGAGPGSSYGGVTLNAALTTGGNNNPTAFAGTITGTGSIIKNGTGTFTLTGANSYTGTTINAGAISAPALSNLGTGNITINGGALLITNSSALSSIGTLLAASYDHNKWDIGTFRSTVITDATRELGDAVVGGQVKVMITLPGDTNLDGLVNSTDLDAISTSGNNWSTGDFNFDGTVNADDWSLFQLGAAIGTLPGNPTPEPAACCLILPAIAMTTRRRRR